MGTALGLERPRGVQVPAQPPAWCTRCLADGKALCRGRGLCAAGDRGNAERAGGKGLCARRPWGGGLAEGRSGLRHSQPFLLPGAVPGSKQSSRGDGVFRGLVSWAPGPTRVSGVSLQHRMMGLPMLVQAPEWGERAAGGVTGEPFPCLGWCVFGRGPLAWPWSSVSRPTKPCCPQPAAEEGGVRDTTDCTSGAGGRTAGKRESLCQPLSPCQRGCPWGEGPRRCQPHTGYAPAQGGGQGHRATPAVPTMHQCLTSVLVLCCPAGEGLAGEEMRLPVLAAVSVPTASPVPRGPLLGSHWGGLVTCCNRWGSQARLLASCWPAVGFAAEKRSASVFPGSGCFPRLAESHVPACPREQ